MVDPLLVMPLPSICRVCNASHSTNRLLVMHPTNPSCKSCTSPNQNNLLFKKLLQQINLLCKSAKCVVLLVAQRICVRSVMIDIFATFACNVGLSLETWLCATHVSNIGNSRFANFYFVSILYSMKQTWKKHAQYVFCTMPNLQSFVYDDCCIPSSTIW